MKGTQISLLCLASGNISCRGFREAVASQEGKCAESSSLLTAKRGVLSRAGVMVTSEHPSPKPRDLGAGTLFITLPFASPKSLLTSSWAVRLHVLVLRSWTPDAGSGGSSTKTISGPTLSTLSQLHKWIIAKNIWRPVVGDTWLHGKFTLGREPLLLQWAIQVWMKLLT